MVSLIYHNICRKNSNITGIIVADRFFVNNVNGQVRNAHGYGKVVFNGLNLNTIF